MPQAKRMPLYRMSKREPKVVKSPSRRDFGSLLIVEDNPVVLQTLLSYFSRNWNVLTAMNGLQALDYLRNFRPDAIIADYCMPELDGVGLARAVRGSRQTRTVPFFLVTATPFAVSELRRSGITRVVKKPFDLPKLEEDLRAAVLDAPSFPPLILPPILPDDPEGLGFIQNWIPRP